METTLRVLAPFLLVLAVVLVISGAGLALFYGHVAYQIFYTPEKIPVISYILGHAPVNPAGTLVNGTVAGQPFQVVLPESMTIYCFSFLMIAAFGLLLSIARCLSGAGIQIIRALWKVFLEPQ